MTDSGLADPFDDGRPVIAPIAPADLLSAGVMSRMEQVQLSTRRRLAGTFSGEHRSPRYGSSLDFADYREYSPGDDYRRVDYQLLARLDILAVKLFEAEDDLNVRILIDTSASMAWGGKFRQAQRLAAALGFMALVRRDAVSVHTFPLTGAAPRFTGRNAAGHLFRHLVDLQPEGETAFVHAAGHMLARPGQAGLTLVISDLLTDEWADGLRRLPRRGDDVIVVHLLSKDDLEPDLEGDLNLIDDEGAASVAVSMSPETVQAYAEIARRWCDEVEEACRHSGAAYQRVLADDDLESVLLGSWRRSGMLR